MRAFPLSFSPALEVEYRVAHTRESMPFVRVMVVLALSIWLLFGVWDHLLFPQQAQTLWRIRAGTATPMALLTLYATYRPSLQPHWQAFLMALAMVGIAALVAMMFHLPDGAAMTHIHPGIQMCLMLCFTAFKLRFVQAFGVGLAGIGLFHWAAAGPLQFPVTAQINSAFFLVGSLFAGALTAWLLESYSRQAFVQRRENDRLVRALEAEKQVAVEANASKSRFLAAASHDLRQPLHAIGLLADLLRDRTRNDDLRMLGDGIHRAVRAMEVQFNGLLDISRLDAGDVTTEIHPMSLDAMAGTLRAVYAPAANERGLALMLEGSGLDVQSDPAQLERILGNLIDNAIKYTERGHVAMTACRDGAQVRIDVVDTGRGIATEHQARIFEEFFQVSNTARDRAQGLGIGLAVVRRLAQLLGHRLEVDSVPGHGSRFSIWAPVAAESAPRRHPARPALATDGAAATEGEASAAHVAEVADELHGAFIVVIDDESAVRQALRAVLMGWGCHVVDAASADDALQQLRNHLRVPDLILSDYRLGDVGNGFDAIERIRAEFESPLVAVLLTGDPHVVLPPALTGVALARKPLHGRPLSRLLVAQLKEGRTTC